MTSYNPLRFFAALVVAGLALLAKALSFNGLYGQDAHEYLHLSRVFFDRLNGRSWQYAGPGASEFAAGYPLAGALLQFPGLEAATALQAISWLSAGWAVWLSDRCLRLLSPGARAASRRTFIAVGLVLAPYFVRAGLTVMSDALGLALTLAALVHGLAVLETRRFRSAGWAVFFAGLAVLTRFSLAALLAPLVAALLLYLWEHGRRASAGLVIAAGLLAVAPHFLLKTGAEQNALNHSLLQDWSVLNFFKATFTNASGTVQYVLPNIFYVFFPLMHPGFCLLLPALLMLAKRTDIHLHTKRVLLACLFGYLLLLGGLPHQNLRYLLPAYAILLLLFFPAWDRMYAYGLYFFKRLTWSIISFVVLVQIAGTVWILRPTLARNRLETGLAADLQPVLPTDAVLFTFDIDGALHTYRPDLTLKNLWAERYEDFPAGSYILFNAEKWSRQWAGQNPVLNWEFVNRTYRLEAVQTWPGGWVLYRIE